MTSMPFVVVVRGRSSPTLRSALLATGATDVLDRVEMLNQDETPVVLIDSAGTDTDRLVTEVTAALAALAVEPDAVITTVRPVTDTLKLVDAESVVTGTAERDRHRFVGTPIAASARWLRMPSIDADGDIVTLLTALAAAGAVVRTGSLFVS
jgi:2-C-methyl-D-erythritol 4-phosphate cytidylyltransferase